MNHFLHIPMPVPFHDSSAQTLIQASAKEHLMASRRSCKSKERVHILKKVNPLV